MRRIPLATVLFLILCSTRAAVASLAVGRASVRPQIDGVLEDVWKDALVYEHFIQVVPAFGAEATAKTEVFLLFDDENLYIATRAHQPRASIRASGSRRDGTSAVDGITCCSRSIPRAAETRPITSS